MGTGSGDEQRYQDESQPLHAAPAPPPHMDLLTCPASELSELARVDVGRIFRCGPPGLKTRPTCCQLERSGYGTGGASKPAAAMTSSSASFVISSCFTRSNWMLFNDRDASRSSRMSPRPSRYASSA